MTKRLLLVAAVALPAAWLANLLLCFTPQVNSSIAALHALGEITAWREAQRLGLEYFDFTSHLARGPGPVPPTLRSLDFWGRPFLYLHYDDGCFVLVSYGSDGKQDQGETYDHSLCQPTVTRSTCSWPTLDTVFVNGLPVRYCLK